MKITTPNIGTQNNNWGNIRLSNQTWKGKEKSLNAFEKFIDVTHGIRAMILVLQTYIKRGKLTINDLVNTYAPPHENDTKEYVNFVSKQSGIPPLSVFDKTKENMYKIIKAMVKIETSNNLPVSVFDTAWKMANTGYLDKLKTIATTSTPVVLVVLAFSALIYLMKK